MLKFFEDAEEFEELKMREDQALSLNWKKILSHLS